ncbi:MAG: EAL domain-containing protein [Cyanobacteria bacterium P01_G01_bin.4]
MQWLLLLYISFNFVATAICTAIPFLVPQKTAQLDWGFRLFVLMTALWCATSGLFFLNETLDDFWFWTGIQLFSYVSVPVLWFYYILQFIQRRTPSPWILSIVPLATLIVYWTPSLSSLMWTISKTEVLFGIPIARYERGFWFNFVHLPYCYGVIFTGHAHLLSAIWQSRKQQRQQFLMLLCCGLTPLFLNFLTLSPFYKSFAFFDLTPIGLALSSILLFWGMSHYKVLQRSPLAYQQIFSSLKDSVLVLEPGYQIIEFNTAAEDLLGCSASTIGQFAQHLFEFLSNSAWKQLITKGEIEVTVDRKYLQFDRQPIYSGKRLLGYILTISDVTQSRQLQEQILQSAILYDALTGLPNRTLFSDRLTQSLNEHIRSEASLAIAFLDVDRFKVINDSLGHAIGDRVLVEITTRIQSCLSNEETAARLGGDEFAILIPKTSPIEVEKLCLQLQTQIQKPLCFENHTINTSVSIGIAFGAAELSVEQLLQHSDIAMYQAKSNGRGRFAIFEQSIAKQAVHRMALEVSLRQAIEQQELFCMFQPIVNIADGRIRGFETLTRWQHPDHGLISPTVFIPIAEEMGMIATLDRWVLYQSCQQLRAWEMQYPHLDLKIAVNLSTANFIFADLAETISQVLLATHFSGRHLKLEITESILMKDPEATARVLQTLAMQGVEVWLDDFGTGHSSLSYLHRLPLAGLKIDRSFVQGAQHNTQSMEIITTIISLAKRLNLGLIAEGVEAESQRQTLLDLGCELGQGYLWWKPLTKQVAAQALAKQSQEQGNTLSRLSRKQ